MRSPNTDSYDIIELAEENEWFIWKGLVESEYRISIECNECDSNRDCNYNGVCRDEQCDCDGASFVGLCLRPMSTILLFNDIVRKCFVIAQMSTLVNCVSLSDHLRLLGVSRFNE